MEKLKILIECPHCDGSGIYVGMGEGAGTSVICHQCDGTGACVYSYTPFTERKRKDGIERVYLQGYGYKLGLGKVNFSNVGEIDMNKEGISYSEFLEGKKPSHIEKLACPMLAEQGACHSIKGFIEECNHVLLVGMNIKRCIYQSNKDKCWQRFKNSLPKGEKNEK